MGRIRSALVKGGIFAVGVTIGYKVGSFLMYLLSFNTYVEHRNQVAQFSFVDSDVAVDLAKLEAVVEFMQAHESASSSPRQMSMDPNASPWVTSARGMGDFDPFDPAQFDIGSDSSPVSIFGELDDEDVQESIGELNEFLEGEFGFDAGVGGEFDPEEFEEHLREQVSESFNIDIDDTDTDADAESDSSNDSDRS